MTIIACVPVVCIFGTMAVFATVMFVYALCDLLKRNIVGYFELANLYCFQVSLLLADAIADEEDESAAASLDCDEDQEQDAKKKIKLSSEQK